METFDFNEWLTTVEIEDASAKTLLEDWFRDSKLTSRDALMGLEFQCLPKDLILGWKFAVMTAVKRLGEFSHRTFYPASLIVNAAFFLISF